MLEEIVKFGAVAKNLKRVLPYVSALMFTLYTNSCERASPQTEGSLSEKSSLSGLLQRECRPKGLGIYGSNCTTALPEVDYFEECVTIDPPRGPNRHLVCGGGIGPESFTNAPKTEKPQIYLYLSNQAAAETFEVYGPVKTRQACHEGRCSKIYYDTNTKRKQIIEPKGEGLFKLSLEGTVEKGVYMLFGPKQRWLNAGGDGTLWRKKILCYTFKIE